MRPAGRSNNQVRPVTLTRNYTKHAEGSVLVEFRYAKVLCTASIEGVPRFLKGQGQGLDHRRVRHAATFLPTPVTLVKQRKVSRVDAQWKPASDRPCSSRSSRFESAG